jgi:sugar phosphate isomerase/epimerase
MKLGICTSVDNSALMESQGWDFVEENCQNLLQGLVSDGEWTGAAQAANSALPILAANVLLPGTMKLVGPQSREQDLEGYIWRIARRAGQIGIPTLVFGSGAARRVPDGFDRVEAAKDIEGFCDVLDVLGRTYQIVFVVEHLRSAECNIINTIEEAMTYVRAVGAPNVQCLVDTYHLWSENEPLAHVREAMPWIKHVHVADLDGRVAPGLSGTSDYRPLFAILREWHYDGLISVEASQFDIENDGQRVLAFLREQWENA